MGRRVDHLRRLQRLTASTGTRFQAHLQDVLDDAIKTFMKHRNWRFMRRNWQGRTYASYNTGLIDVTQGDRKVDRDVTGPATAWHKGFSGGLIAITPSSGSTDWYRVREVQSASDINLDGPYMGDTASGLSYTLYQDTYFLPHDCEGLFARSVWHENYSFPLVPYDVEFMEQLMHTITPNVEQPYAYSEGFYNQTVMHTTGTLTITDGSPTVTGVGTDWANAVISATNGGETIEGVPIRINLPDDADGTPNRARLNGVAEVTGATGLILDEDPNIGSNQTGLTYEIGPRGSKMIRLYPVPVSSRAIGGWYRRAYLGMYDDKDTTGIPDEYDDCLNYLAAYLALLQIPGDQAQSARGKDFYQMYLNARGEAAAKDHSNREFGEPGQRIDWSQEHDLDRLPATVRYGNYGAFDVS